jgi:uncharacterized protein YjbJ (UPF0337 family)
VPSGLLAGELTVRAGGRPTTDARLGAHRFATGGFMTNTNFDTLMGRVKEAVGALSGNKRLKDEGRIDQAKGSVKNAVDKVADVLTDQPADHTQN